MAPNTRQLRRLLQIYGFPIQNSKVRFIIADDPSAGHAKTVTFTRQRAFPYCLKDTTSLGHACENCQNTLENVSRGRRFFRLEAKGLCKLSHKI